MPKKINENIFNGMISRSAVIDSSKINTEQRSIRSIIATESPVVVFDWKRYEPIREILILDGMEIPESRKVVLLDTHSRWGVSSLRGSIRNIQIEQRENEKVLAGDVFFSSNAEKEWNDARDGHLTDISAGYKTFTKHSIELRPGESKEVNGRTYKNDFDDGLNLFIRIKSTLKEGSLVVIGADDKSQMGREEYGELTYDELLQRISKQDSQLEKLNIKISEIKSNGERNMSEKTPEQIREAERLRIADIEKDAERVGDRVPNVVELKRTAINEGWEVAKFQTELYNRMLISDKPVDNPATHLDLSRNDIKSFSVTRAMQSVLSGKWGKEKTFEFEASQAIRNKLEGEARSEFSIFIPHDVLLHRADADLQKRVLNVTSNAAGSYLVGTDHLGKNFIEILREESVLMQAGIQVLPGLRGNIQIPKQLTEAEFQWVGTGAANQSFMTFGQVTASPKTGSATTEYGRQLVLQSEPVVDTLVVNDLYAVAALGVDAAGIHGTGSNNQPLGLMNETGIGGVDCSTFNWSKIVEFKKKIRKAKAAKLGSMKWLGSPDVEALALATPKAANQAIYLMNDDGKMASMESLITNQVEDDILILGIWNQMMMCEWGVVELLINPYGVNSRAGNVEVTIFVSVDFIIRQSAAFSIGENVPIPS